MAVQFQDYYATLGVAREATREEIQRAYRSLARKHHPDVDKTPGATQRFAQIGEAYEVLKDPEKRKRYDALGARWKEGQEFTPPPGWQSAGGPGRRSSRTFTDFEFDSPSGFSSFFEAFFGGGAQEFDPSGMRGGRPGARAGGSLEAALEIGLEEAYAGATRTITLASSPDGEGARTYDVKIPPGTTEGSTIRLRGQGAPGLRGGPAGDLLLHVRLLPHERFAPDGVDLSTEARISPPEAALGAKVPLRLLDGTEVVVTVPPGSSSGKKLRLRGMGLPRAGDPGRGDLIVELQVAVPEALSPDERRAYEELARVSRFDPRSSSVTDSSTGSRPRRP